MAGEIQINSVTLATESGGTITLSSDVDTSTPTKTALNASGSAPIYACRAWVNFDGTGTVAIQASGNVSSITDEGSGEYTINFTTAMPNANYSAVSMFSDANESASAYAYFSGVSLATRLAGSFRIISRNGGNSSNPDCAAAMVAIFC